MQRHKRDDPLRAKRERRRSVITNQAKPVKQVQPNWTRIIATGWPNGPQQ
jgi:hypothetical protein